MLREVFQKTCLEMTFEEHQEILNSIFKKFFEEHQDVWRHVFQTFCLKPLRLESNSKHCSHVGISLPAKKIWRQWSFAQIIIFLEFYVWKKIWVKFRLKTKKGLHFNSVSNFSSFVPKL